MPSGERTEIGQIVQVSLWIDVVVEYFDPEGKESPEGEWRLRKQSGSFDIQCRKRVRDADLPRIRKDLR